MKVKRPANSEQKVEPPFECEADSNVTGDASKKADLKCGEGSIKPTSATENECKLSPGFAWKDENDKSKGTEKIDDKRKADTNFCPKGFGFNSKGGV